MRSRQRRRHERHDDRVGARGSQVSVKQRHARRTVQHQVVVVLAQVAAHACISWLVGGFAFVQMAVEMAVGGSAPA